MWEWLLALLGSGGETAATALPAAEAVAPSAMTAAEFSSIPGAVGGSAPVTASAGMVSPEFTQSAYVMGPKVRSPSSGGFMSSLAALADSSNGRAFQRGMVTQLGQNLVGPSSGIPHAPLMPPPRGGSGVYRPSAYTFAELMKVLASRSRRGGTPFAAGGGPGGA